MFWTAIRTRMQHGCCCAQPDCPHANHPGLRPRHRSCHTTACPNAHPPSEAGPGGRSTGRSLAARGPEWSAYVIEARHQLSIRASPRADWPRGGHSFARCIRRAALRELLSSSVVRPNWICGALQPVLVACHERIATFLGNSSRSTVTCAPEAKAPGYRSRDCRGAPHGLDRPDRVAAE